MDARPLVAAERRDLHSFLRELDPEAWDHPSLCEGWRVRDVVAHLIQFDEGGLGPLLVDLVRSRFDVGRTNQLAVDRRVDWTPARLLETLERQITPGRLSRTARGVPALFDALVHHQDIRRPLGRPRAIPEERLRVALDAARRSPFVGGRRRARGLRLVAADIDWAHGAGPEVRGPAEALVMALSGRAVALDDLEGEGVDELVARC